MEQRKQTSLEFLAQAIGRQSKDYILMAVDHEDEDRVLVACRGGNAELISLLIDFCRTSPHNKELVESAISMYDGSKEGYRVEYKGI